MSVLLPQPLGPRMQANRRERKQCEIPSSATMPFPGLPQSLQRASTITSMARLLLHAPSRDKAMAQSALLQDFRADPLGLRNEVTGVGLAREAAIAIDDLAIHENGACVAAFARIDEARERTMLHADIRLGEVEDRNIGAFAGVERADLVLEPERLGGIDGGHLDCALGGHARRVEVTHMLHQRAGFHLLHHV